MHFTSGSANTSVALKSPPVTPQTLVVTDDEELLDSELGLEEETLLSGKLLTELLLEGMLDTPVPPPLDPPPQADKRAIKANGHRASKREKRISNLFIVIRVIGRA